MASVRTGSRTDDTTYVQVLHRLNGRQTSFHDQGGPAKVPEVIAVDPRPQTTMRAEWPKHLYRAVEQFGWKWAGWWRTW